MKRRTPTAFAVFAGYALMMVAVALLFWKASSPERETPPTRSASAPEMPRKSARSDRPGTKSRRNKAEEPPLSPAAREARAKLTEPIEQDQDGRILLKECREAGVRASDFLDLVSDLKARGPDTNLWNLEIILEAVAEMDGQAMAAWYDQNVSIDFVRRHNWTATDSLFTTVATGWMRSEPREAIRWAQDHPHLASLQSVRNYWRADDYTGHIAWIEDQFRSGDRVIESLSPAIGHWSRRDPKAAVQWMESFATDNIPSSFVRSKGYEELAREWHEDRLAEAVEWLTNRPQDVAGNDPARSVVAKRLTKSDPVGAIDVAMEIADRRQAEKLIINAARNLYRSEPDTVIDWLPESGLSEEAQRAILSPDS